MPRFEDLAAEGQALVEVGGAVVGVDVATQAELDAAQAAAVQRANHTGEQPVATVTGLQSALDAKAPLASPALTGTPTVPTAPAGTNTTQAASTAFVQQVTQNATSGYGFPYTVDPLLLNASRGVDAANRTYYYRVKGGGTLSKIALMVSTQSGNISLGVYSNTGTGRSARPGARQATTGAVACPAAGFAAISLGASVTVSAGDWFAISADNTTAQFVAVTGGALSGLAEGVSAYETVHPVPTTPTIAAGAFVTGRTIGLVGVA